MGKQMEQTSCKRQSTVCYLYIFFWFSKDQNHTIGFCRDVASSEFWHSPAVHELVFPARAMRPCHQAAINACGAANHWQSFGCVKRRGAGKVAQMCECCIGRPLTKPTKPGHLIVQQLTFSKQGPNHPWLEFFHSSVSRLFFLSSILLGCIGLISLKQTYHLTRWHPTKESSLATINFSGYVTMLVSRRAILYFIYLYLFIMMTFFSNKTCPTWKKHPLGKTHRAHSNSKPSFTSESPRFGVTVLELMDENAPAT